MACLALDSRYSLLSRQLPPAFNLGRASVSERRQKQARIVGVRRLKTEIPMPKNKPGTALPV